MGRLAPVAFLLVVAIILSACQAAPTATPTKPPATATTMPALSQPTPTKAPDAPAAPTTAPVAPTATRPPATATAVPKPAASGKLTIVYNDEVLSLDHAVSQPAARAVMVSVRESLTDMDAKSFKLVGLLA